MATQSVIKRRAGGLTAAVDAGDVIYRQGDASDSYFIVVQGRLRAINEKRSGGVEILSEYGQGDSVGEVECITAGPRSATVHAIRDTELVRIPVALFNAIASRHPSITIQARDAAVLPSSDLKGQMTRAIASRARDDHVNIARLGATPANEVVRNRNLNLKVRSTSSCALACR